MIIASDHISLVSEHTVQEICKPLFQTMGLNYFMFARFYKDGTIAVLPSCAKWHKYFWEKDYHRNSKIRLMPGFQFWKLNKNFSQANIDAMKFFNIDNKLDFVQEFDEYYDIFGFASYNGNTGIIDTYLNKQNSLRKFALYFKEQAGGILESAIKKENRLYIEEVKDHFNKESNDKKLNLDINRYRFGDTTLTKNEMKILVFTLRARTALEIANVMHMSPKTVEAHIQKIKQKFSCNSRSELFDKMFSLDVIDFVRDSLHSKII